MYGFRVRRLRYYPDEDCCEEISELPPGVDPALIRWSVSLPHQCSDWEIIGSDKRNDSEFPVLAEAITRLEEFLAEAQAALAVLTRGETLEREA